MNRAEAHLEHSNFSSNTAQVGGALFTSASHVVAIENTLANNSARRGFGGGGALVAESTLDGRLNVFDGNRCGRFGGALYLWFEPQRAARERGSTARRRPPTCSRATRRARPAAASSGTVRHGRARGWRDGQVLGRGGQSRLRRAGDADATDDDATDDDDASCNFRANRAPDGDGRDARFLYLDTSFVYDNGTVNVVEWSAG